VEPCQKSYGSEGSLSQHLKLKHNEFYKSHIFSMDAPDKSKDDQDSLHDSSDIKEKKPKEDIVLWYIWQSRI
jgi:hypothetical protein